MVVGRLLPTRSLLWTFLAISILFLLLCIDPDLPSSALSSFLRAWSSFTALLTPTVLFFLMNAVVFALAFQSKAPFLAKPGGIAESEDAEELAEDAYPEDGFEEDEVDDHHHDEDDVRNAALYPELLASFFGEDHTPRSKLKAKKKKTTQLSASKNPSPNPKPRSTSVTNSSFKPRPILNPNPSFRASPQPVRHHHATNSNKINGVIKARAMSLSRVNAYGEAADLGAEKAATLKSLPEQAASGSESAPGHIYGYGDDKNIDERADAFIDSFYSRMKAPQVDPYLERLERSRRR